MMQEAGLTWSSARWTDASLSATAPDILTALPAAAEASSGSIAQSAIHLLLATVQRMVLIMSLEKRVAFQLLGAASTCVAGSCSIAPLREIELLEIFQCWPKAAAFMSKSVPS